jgi:hypothetical protein
MFVLLGLIDLKEFKRDENMENKGMQSHEH